MQRFWVEDVFLAVQRRPQLCAATLEDLCFLNLNWDRFIVAEISDLNFESSSSIGRIVGRFRGPQFVCRFGRLGSVGRPTPDDVPHGRRTTEAS